MLPHYQFSFVLGAGFDFCLGTHASLSSTSVLGESERVSGYTTWVCCFGTKLIKSNLIFWYFKNGYMTQLGSRSLSWGLLEKKLLCLFLDEVVLYDCRIWRIYRPSVTLREVSRRVSWTDRSQIRELEKNCALGDNALMN